MEPFSPADLYKTLKDLSVIDAKKLDEAYKESQETKTSFAEILLSKDLITDENLGKTIADLINAPFIKLSKETIDENFLKIIPETVAKTQQIIVFGKDKKGLKVATINPHDKEMLQFISQKTGLPVQVYYATHQDLAQASGLYKKDLQKTFDSLLAETIDKVDTKDSELSITKIVDLLIEYAYSNRASDIHIEPEEEKTLIRFRIDGILHDVLKVPKKMHDHIISRIKVLAKLRIDEHLSAQDGKLQVKLSDEELDVRISVVPITNGEKVVMRLLSSHSRQFGLTDLGISGDDLDKVKNGFSKPYGMVLVTGPTGSGKTTTIYAILKIINTREKNIATIEDPVEYEIAGINQIQVNSKTNLTFAEGLRSILRQDPDIMFVGEIRDDETAGIAINSAMTGHLVLSTLHTNDAATTLPRLIDMGIEPFLVASTVNVIIGQRLVRRLCEECRYSVETPRTALVQYLGEAMTKKHFGAKKEVTLYQAKGCEVCHQIGYVGRVGLFEVLEVSDAIRELITQKADSDMIMKQALAEGMTNMLDDGIKKVIQGVTNFEEILRATKE